MALPDNRNKNKNKVIVKEIVDPPTPPADPPTPPADPPADPPTPPADPPADPPTPPSDVDMDLDELVEKKNEELTAEEREYLKNNQDWLSDEEKVKFGFKQPETPPTPPTNTPPANNNEPDWKARYAGSSREAQVLVEQKNKMVNAVDDAEKLPAPTDDEMRKIVGEEAWEMMDDAQKIIARGREHNQRKFDYVQKVRGEFRQSEQFMEKVKTFVSDPEVIKNCPKIEGHEDEFRQYCMMPSHLGSDLEVLYRAWTTELPAPPAPKRRTLLAPGGGQGGGTPAPKSDEYTPQQLEIMRTKEPKKYMDLVRKGKVKISV